MTSLLDAPPERTGRAGALGLVGTAAVHGIVIAGASLLGLGGVTALQAAPVTEMVEVALPEPEPPKAPEPEAPKAAPVARERPVAPAPEPPPETPPQGAQGGEVLDAKADVVDFGDRFVTGSGSSYAGGVTDAAGTSKAAVHDASARGAGAPVVEKPKAVDLSRRAQLADGVRWTVPFPLEADDAGIDHAVVTLRIEVAVDGSVRNVTVLSDPGNGFGRDARRFGTSKRWLPALNREGKPVASVEVVNVRFDR